MDSINPVKPIGRGKGGAYCDEDITILRFVLLESDILPPDLQLSFFAKLKLPIAAIVSSGGRSFHVWVKVDCGGLANYRQMVEEMLSLLKCFGIDQANKNPSRMSRLVGVQRLIRAVGDGRQRLLYLNPTPSQEVSIL